MLEQGQPEQAAWAARAVRDDTRRAKVADDEILAACLLARALLAQGKYAEAENELGSVSALAPRSKASGLDWSSQSLARWLRWPPARLHRLGNRSGEHSRKRRRQDLSSTSWKRSSLWLTLDSSRDKALTLAPVSKSSRGCEIPWIRSHRSEGCRSQRHLKALDARIPCRSP